MREIKFRAKDYQTNKWVYGFLFMGKGDDNRDYAFILQDKGLKVGTATEGNAIEFTCDEAHLVDIETICQYTGLKDKNGKEIYEGDVLEIAALDFLDKAKNKKNFIVKYENGFICHIVKEPHCWMHLKTAYEKSSYKLKKIGNIYDNPELVEG